MKNLNPQFGENRLVFLGFGAPKGNPEAAKSTAEVPKDKLVKITCDVLKCKADAPKSELKKRAKSFMSQYPKPDKDIARINKVKDAAKKHVKASLEDDSQVIEAANKVDSAIQRLAMTENI